ncbi:ABC-2 type transport system permease protein [Nitrosomonas marina]|uniref:ABC-2 type transport system permease protein n=1 Tax=Nitrosomonas marina TaxID=917 RepID=A0A1I0DJN4_9PROT|nr:ABC transporter permease subunit [Nitrosomonas marina]SET32551.1 ABC-2 type transport system permease protein [Nitrosomonas marina]
MIFTIARKELYMMFCSPLAWLLLTSVQLLFAWFFLGRLDAFLQLQPQLMQIANPPGFTEIIVTPVFALSAVVLLLMVPLLTMRQFAEERKNNTLTLLLSAPVSITEIVLGKFLGLTVFFLGVVSLIVSMFLTLLAGGTLDLGLLISGAFGLFLLICCFVALGLYISSLTIQPVVAAIGMLAVMLGFWMVDLVISDHEGWIYYFSIFKQFELFNNGLVDTYSLVYCALFTAFFLVLTIRRLDGERLHG